MAKPSKSKNQLVDDDTNNASNTSEEDDEVLEADANSDLEGGAKSTSTDNATGTKQAKTAKKLTGKRRKVFISSTKSEDSCSVEVVLSNEDLLIEILFVVPAKSLLKFKSVCTHWHSLISDSKFASNHACRNPSSALISGLYVYPITWSTKEPKSVSLHDHLCLPTLAFLDPVRERLRSRVVDSCNGLLLFSNGDKMQYIVCNPTTQKYIALPRQGGSTSSSYSEKFGAYLAFDPSKSPYYKVVLSASWKEMRVEAPNGGSYRQRVFWNGALHWMSHDNFHIRFDVNAEILTGTPMPKVPNILDEDKFLYFGKCGGSLLLIQTRDEHWALGFRILEMKKDCCRWTVKCRVNLRALKSLFPEEYAPHRVLCCLNGANEKDFMLVLVIPGKVIAYNLNSKTVKVLLEFHGGASPDDYRYYDTHHFIESLYPL